MPRVIYPGLTQVFPPGPAATAAVSWGYQAGGVVRPTSAIPCGRVVDGNVRAPGPAATASVAWGYQEGSPSRPPAPRVAGRAILPDTWPPLSTTTPGAVFWGWQSDRTTRPAAPPQTGRIVSADIPAPVAVTIWGWPSSPLRPVASVPQGRVIPTDVWSPPAVTVWGWAGEPIRPPLVSPLRRPADLRFPFSASPPPTVPGTWGWELTRPIMPPRLAVTTPPAFAAWIPFQPPPAPPVTGGLVCGTPFVYCVVNGNPFVCCVANGSAGLEAC